MRFSAIRCSLLAVACCAGLVSVSAPEPKKPASGTLSAIRPDRYLAEALEPYGLKALRYSDGVNVFQALYYAPKGRGSRKLPLLVYLPGNGEKGDLINQFHQRAIFELVTGEEFQKRTPCHLLAISPPASLTTLSGGEPGKPNVYQRLMHDFVFEVVRRSFSRIDRTRIYLTGFSYGGAGVYALLQHYPGEFAAGLPIASLPPLEEYFDERHPWNCWHFYNEGDYARSGMPVAGLQSFRKRTNAAGGDFRIGSYPGGEHDAWTAAWKESEVWRWMFSKSLGGKNDRGRTARDAAVGCPCDLSAAKCTASVRGRDGTHGPERAADGLDETAYEPERAFTKKDWWMVEFPAPVVGKVELLTGDREGNGRLKRGYVEVSANGRTWTRVGAFSNRDGACRFVRKEKFTQLRIRSAEDGKAPFVLRRCRIGGLER